MRSSSQVPANPGRAAAVGSVALVALTVAVLIAIGGAGPRHHLFVVVPDATDALPGQYVHAAGQSVGNIASMEPVQRGRAVRIDLALTNQAWPLPTGTKFVLRWGGTISYDNRFVELTRGPANASPLADGETLPTADFTAPVEFDQLIGTFNPGVRAGLKSFLDRGGVTFRVAAPSLRNAIAAAPPALVQASYVFKDLDANETALDTLIKSTDHVVAAVHAANPGIGTLLSGAATTFAATASQANALQATLSAAPPTLIAARATLAHADRTLTAAQSLVTALSPGVTQLRALAAPLDSALQTIVTVGPTAITTLQVAHRATPDLNAVLAKATTLMPEIGSIGRQSVTQLQCVRPYTPDIVSFFSSWADWLSPTDNKDRYGRANAQTLIPAGNNAETVNSGQIAAQYPGLRYGFPRPPGANAGQPWFLPQCGAGHDALDPNKDPEARPYNPIEQLSGTASANGGSHR